MSSNSVRNHTRDKQIGRCAVVRFYYHSYDISPNWILLSPITIILFYDSSANSGALIGNFQSSVSGQTHKFIIYAMRQRTRKNNLAGCYRKKRKDVSFSCVCPVIDNKYGQNVVKVVCRSTRLAPRGSTANLTML